MLDHKALDAFIRSVLKQKGVREDELNDTVQDTWIALLTRGAFERADNVKAYVARTATNVWKDLVKKDAPYRPTKKAPGTRNRARIRKDEMRSVDAEDYVTLATPTPSIEDRLLHRVDLKIAVEDALQRLTKRQFRIVTLKMEGHRTREIAEQMGLGVQRVQRDLLEFREGAPLVRNSR